MESTHVNPVMRYHHAFSYFNGYKFPYPLAITLDGISFDQYLEGIAAERILCNKTRPILHEEWALMESIVNPEKSPLLGFEELTAAATFTTAVGPGTSIIRVPTVKCLPILRETFQRSLLESIQNKELKTPSPLCSAYSDALFAFWLKSRSNLLGKDETIAQLRALSWPNSTIVRFVSDHNTIARGALGVITFTPPCVNKSKHHLKLGHHPVFVALNGVRQAVTHSDVESVSSQDLDFSSLENFITSARLNVNPFDSKHTLAALTPLVLAETHEVQAKYLAELLSALHVLDNPVITKFDLPTDKYPLTWHVKPGKGSPYAISLGKFPGHNTTNWLLGIPFSRLNPLYPKQFEH